MKPSAARARLGATGVLVLLVVSAWMAAGCSPTPPRGPTPSPSTATLPRRIVSLAPNITEILFALGAGPRVIACTNRCNHPPEAASLPRIGDVTLDFERIVSAGPDLLVAESVTTDKDVARLRSLRLRVLQVNSTTLEGYFETLRILGSHTGTQAQATRLTGSLQRAVERLQKRNQGIPDAQRPRVLVEIQARPLISVGHGTFIDEMVTLAGGSNILADAVGSYPQVDPEAVVVRDPEVVILTLAGDEAAFGRRPGFGNITAVQRHGVHVIDPDLLVRPSPRLEQGLAILASWMREAVQARPVR